MARYRKIDMRMHADAKYRRLTPCPPCGQALWWHLLAGKQTGIIPGICSIGEAAFAEQLGWHMKGFREAFREVFAQGMAKADWEAPLLWVPNSVKYNHPTSPNVIRSWEEEWLMIPECDLKTEAYHHLKAFVEGLGKGFREAFEEAIAEPFGHTFRQSGAGAGAGAGAGVVLGTTTITTTDPSEKPSPKFTPPSLEEVQTFCREHGHQIDPQRFIDYYTANGWKVGRNPMKDWKAAVRTWSKNEVSRNGHAVDKLRTDFNRAANEFLARGGVE